MSLDDATIRAFAAHLEAEAAFGIDALPRGERVAVPDSASLPAAPPPPPVRAVHPGKTLESVGEAIASCTACSLCGGRTKTVPGQGHPRARLMFVGEAPGYHEDQSGLAFVGRAGQLLTKMIQAMGLDRDEVFICNILKCRPPENREPGPEEAAACFHFLMDQIDLVRPDVICALGSHAANNLLERSQAMGRLRGRVFDFRGIKLVPTYHPSYLLRNPHDKRKTWEDLQVVMGLLA